MRGVLLQTFGALLASLAISTGGLAAQVLSGVVLEAGTDRPIPFAEVTILGDTGGVAVETLSDGTGEFTARLTRAGRYQVYAVRLGYYSAVSGFTYLARGEGISVAVRLQPKPLETDSLTVEVSSRMPPLERVGFYDRMRAGIGSFYSRLDIRSMRGMRNIATVIREAPGVRLSTDQFGKDRVTLRTALGGSCLPALILDGVGISPPWEDIVELEDLDGVEVYARPTQVPARFYGLVPFRNARSSSSAQCGLVVAWTRQGNSRR